MGEGEGKRVDEKTNKNVHHNHHAGVLKITLSPHHKFGSQRLLQLSSSQSLHSGAPGSAPLRAPKPQGSGGGKGGARDAPGV